MASAAGPEDYKQQFELLLVEKNQIEAEFGQKRAQFRQMFLELEGQLKNQKELTKQLEVQVKDLTRKNDDLKSEIEGVRTAAQLTNETEREQLVSLKQSHQEEIASLHHIYNEHAKENQSRLANQFEEERNKLLETIGQLEKKLQQQQDSRLQEDPQLASDQQAGLISTLSSAFGKKASGGNQPQKQQQKNDGSLDVSQQQVQQDVEGWKSIVDPLEKEVSSLRKQLEEAQNKIMSLEKDEMQEKFREMKKTIDCERSARTDLEMYVNVLNTQKGVLQEDSDKLKRELHNVCRLFETEKMSHSELKQTWKLANEQFLSQQTKLSNELERTKKILTPQQREQLSKEMRQDRNINLDSPVIQTVPEHPYQATVGDSRKSSTPSQKSMTSGDMLLDFDPLAAGTDNNPSTTIGGTTSQKDTLLKQSKKRTPQMNRKGQPTEDKQQTISDTLLNTFFPAAAQARQFNELIMKDAAMSEKPLVLSSSSEDSDDEDLVQAIHKQNKQRYNVETAIEVEEADEADAFDVQLSKHSAAAPDRESSKVSLKKSNSSGDILNPNINELALPGKSLSQGDVSSPSPSQASTTFTDEVDSKLSLNETGWSTLSDDYYNHTCMMCQNYEKQLQRLQKDYITVKDNEKTLVNNVKALRGNLEAEKDKFTSLEKSIDTVNVDTKSQIKIYNTNQEEVDKQVKLLHTQFKQFRDDMVKELKALSEERDKAIQQNKEVTQGYEEKLKELPSRLSAEDEEQLKTEIMFLKDRVMAEQVDRESTESVLQQDLKDAKDQIVKLKAQIEKYKADDATQDALLSF